MLEIKKLQRQFASACGRRSNVEGVWDEIDKWFGVQTDGSTSSQEGQGNDAPQLRKDVWDFTAIDGREKLASSIHGSITSPSVRWFQGAYRDNRLNRDPDAVKYRDEVMDEVWNTIQDSDFNSEIAAAYYDLVGAGNCFLSLEPVYTDSNETELEGVDFTAIPLREAFFDCNRRGEIKTFWRRLYFFPSEAVDLALTKGWGVPEQWQKMLDSGSGDKIEVVYCVFERPEILRRKKLVYPAAPDQRPYGCVWWQGANGQQLGEEGGYYERPVHWCPWAKTAGARWGYGLGNISLPTVRYLNAWMQAYKTQGEKVLNPPQLVNERALMEGSTAINMRPGGTTVVRDVLGIRPLEQGSNFVVAENVITDLRAQIRQIFRTDDLQLKESPAMTATEVQVRYELMNRVLGKTLTLVQTKLLSPVILALISILGRSRRLREMPENVRKAGGFLGIEYQGPLARAQRTDEVASIERGATLVAGLAQFYPEARAYFDPGAAIRKAFDLLGIPADLIPDQPVIDKEIESIRGNIQRAAEADAKQKEAKAAKDAAEAQGAAPPVAGATYPELPPRPYLAPTGQVA